MAAVSRESRSVLVVEDDPYVLDFLESSMDHSGFRVYSAKSTEEARAVFEQAEIEDFYVILSDFRLPTENGLEFLEWVRARDPALSLILITGQGDKEVIEGALKLGVCEYLEKPITYQTLLQSTLRAVEQTRKQRQSIEDRREIEHLSQFDLRLSTVIPQSLMDRLTVHYQPLHEVGGDLFITHTYAPSEWVLFIGDVSGHDIHSGFVSTYFQGMFRGCVENGSYVSDFLDLFNRTLRKEFSFQVKESDPVSLSVSAFYINEAYPEIFHWNFGFTPAYFMRRDGVLMEGPYGNFPLGWADEISGQHQAVAKRNLFKLCAFTDGLIELAADLEISPFSLFFWLEKSGKTIKDLPIVAKDDILTVSYLINPTVPTDQQYNPLLSEHYSGSEVEHIDELQDNWRRSLAFALDDRLGDRLYDLLICIREGMLNALIHGCDRAPDKFAHLQISINEPSTWIRVVIDDPGKGHQFDLKKRLMELNQSGGKHLGLGIIQHLSDSFAIENLGTSLVFDFQVNP